tara:strand:+ start:544 stop:798 length:255 start_codon:yes stop_codon:yes gene_type:complete
MSITGSVVIYVIIWWIIFFSALPIGIKHDDKNINNNLEGADPGAPKNPNIFKKFLFTTLITTVIFIGIYYIVSNDHFNLREFIK